MNIQQYVETIEESECNEYVVGICFGNFVQVVAKGNKEECKNMFESLFPLESHIEGCFIESIENFMKYSNNQVTKQ